MANQSLIRSGLENLVNKNYIINIEEIAEDLSIELVNDRLNFETLADAPKPTLQSTMLATIAWSEYIATRKAVISAKLSSFKISMQKNMAEKKINYMKSKENARGSKTEAEMYVDGLNDFQNDKIKISNYESYISYMDSLSRQLDMIHYACKELLKDSERFEKLS